jgi:iron complex transport system ATP-binding protein
MNTQPIIKLRNITVRRSNRPILNNVSLDLFQDEHVAIIGSNGAGRSTLVQIISQEVHPLYSPTSERLIFGKERWHVLELRKKMGIVSAALQHLCTTSYPVRHIVLSGFFSSIGLDFHHQITDEMIKQADQRLEEQGVLHLAEKPMRTLSSGEARRVLLARATVHNPTLMLLDEAVSNLDMPAKRAYRKALKNFTSNNKTLILVTHDLSEIIEEIERVIVLKDGKILADGKKSAILNEELLSEAYGTRVFLSQREGRYNAWC